MRVTGKSRASTPMRETGIWLGVLAMLLALNVTARTISSATYAEPVQRYGHFALGQPHEYARLNVTTLSGRNFSLRLPDDEVFEDLVPRVVRLADDEQAILTIISKRSSGARLALIHWVDDALAIGAQSAPIGSPMRWLNPVGVADLDDDGRAEIAAVITPHIGGTLKVYRQHGGQLIEIAAMAGFSNHVYRSTELALSTPMPINGRMHLLVPDDRRRQLRIIELRNEALVEVGRCELAAPITDAITVISAREISIGKSDRAQFIAPGDCIR